MRLPRLFATGLWAAATVGSTAMIWTATSVVAADVTDRPPSVLAHHEVVSDLESALSGPTTTPTTTAPAPDLPTATVPAGDRGPAPGGANAPMPPAPPSRTPTPAVTVAPFSPSPTPATVPPAPLPDAEPGSPPTTQPPSRPTATYSTTGGVVRVACSGIFIDLVSAIPRNGYAVDVVAGGPANVDVRFVGPGEEVSVKAVCFGQPIRYYDQGPPPRQPPGS
ncbi:MAG: hypothetical protein ACR2G7_02310 [Acidimicrobiales bacterium]